jgi:serpin B
MTWPRSLSSQTSQTRQTSGDGRGRRRGPVRGTALVLSLALAAGCASGSAAVETRAPVKRSAPTRTSTSVAVTATDTLAASLYRRLASTPGNLVFSPYSIELALAMTRTGARGATRTQMDRVLGAPGGAALDQSFNALDQTLATRSGRQTSPERTGQVSLSVANQLWGQQGFGFRPTFLDGLAADYGAGMKLVDFEHQTESARTAINDWATQQTHGRIPDLIPAGVLDDSTRLVLANALYLKAPWRTEFSAPTPQPFHGPGGSTSSVPTMAEGAGGAVEQGAGWRAVEVPYLGDALSMVLIVPDDLARFERTLDGPELAAITAGLSRGRSRVSMPTFQFTQHFSLAQPLAALGMPLAFSDRADFTGMTDQAPLHISAVVHKAFIAVDQHGTEAAAATAVAVALSAGIAEPPTVFKADRPFVFAIRDVRTGAILFLGRVTDPTTST